MSYYADMQEVVGKTIVSVKINEDDTAIALVDEQGIPHLYRTEGDCCSESWFSDIIGLPALLGHSVIAVEKKTEEEVEATRQEQDILYGFTLKTAQGHCDINFRNSSNGYYGGWCVYDGIADADLNSYREIREDFHS